MVPHAAYSAATLLALGADEIIMHPNGNLGPVDPQISVKTGDTEQHFAFEELSAFLEFAREEVGLTDQEHIRDMFHMVCEQVGTLPVGFAARSSQLSLSMGEKLLRLHMTGEAGAQKAKTIAELLNKSYFHHGYPLGRREAEQINLPVVACPEIEDLMWRIWADIESDLQIRMPFSNTHVLLSSPERTKLLAPVAQYDVPPGAPPDVMKSVISALISKALIEINPVDFEVTIALMESSRLASREVRRGTLLACRMPDLKLKTTTVSTGAAWEPVPF